MSFDLIVYTAHPLDDSAKAELTQRLMQKYQIDGVAFSEDKALIGGMKLVFRDHIQDFSVAAKLRGIKKHLTSETV